MCLGAKTCGATEIDRIQTINYRRLIFLINSHISHDHRQYLYLTYNQQLHVHSVSINIENIDQFIYMVPYIKFLPNCVLELSINYQHFMQCISNVIGNGRFKKGRLAINNCIPQTSVLGGYYGLVVVKPPPRPQTFLSECDNLQNLDCFHI